MSEGTEMQSGMHGRATHVMPSTPVLAGALVRHASGLTRATCCRLISQCTDRSLTWPRAAQRPLDKVILEALLAAHLPRGQALPVGQVLLAQTAPVVICRRAWALLAIPAAHSQDVCPVYIRWSTHSSCPEKGCCQSEHLGVVQQALSLLCRGMAAARCDQGHAHFVQQRHEGLMHVGS